MHSSPPRALVLVALVGCTTTGQPPERPAKMDPFDATVLAAAREAVRLGPGCGLGGRFQRASLTAREEAGTWNVVLDDKQPSSFDGPDACSAGPGPIPATVCHRQGEHTVCSKRALVALAGYDREASAAGQVPVTLLHALGHELAHVVKDHDVAIPSPISTAPRTDEERLAHVRGRVDQAGAQLALEEEADRAAACIVAATIPPETAGDARREAAVLRVQLAFRAAFTALDEKIRCLFEDRLTLPASPQEMEVGARRVLCAAMRSSPFAPPLLRGTHPDWGGRMATLYAALPRPPRPAALRDPIMSLVAQVNDIFMFMEAHTDAHYRDLAFAVRKATFEYDAAKCDFLGEPSPCAPLQLPDPAVRTGSVTWATTGTAPGSASLSGKIVAADVRGTAVALALELPDRVAVWEPFGGKLRVADMPCHPRWASLDGPTVLVACDVPGVVVTIDGDHSVLAEIGPAMRTDDPGPANVAVRWVGAIGGKRLLSAGYPAGGGFVLDWTEGRFREIGAGTGNNCIPFASMAPHRIEAHPVTGHLLAAPLHDPATLYVLSPDGARQLGELGTGVWQTWALEHDQAAPPGHVCRASHLGPKGVRCVLEDLHWIDPEREVEKQEDGRATLPEKLQAPIDHVDFCDTKRARFAVVASRNEVLAFEVQGGGKALVGRQPGEGMVTACGDELFAVGFVGPKGVELRAFQ